MIHLRDAGGQSTIAKVRVRDVGGLSVIAKGRLRDAGGLSEVFSSSGALTLTPDYLSGYGASNSTITVTTNGYALLSNVPAGATIVWHSSLVGVTAVSPSAPYTLFRANCAPEAVKTATVYATVNGTDTNSITVELTNGGIL